MNEIIEDVKREGVGYRMAHKSLKILCYVYYAVVTSESEDDLQRTPDPPKYRHDDNSGNTDNNSIYVSDVSVSISLILCKDKDEFYAQNIPS
ncbi:hypothetical protein HUJ04_001473 [Dendroctonus ponderosae]|nr:hypothetical protein HUJ04_001473 [Dendroctonus ponderosae]